MMYQFSYIPPLCAYDIGAPGAMGFAALSPPFGRPCDANLMYYPESVSHSGVRFEKLLDYEGNSEGHFEKWRAGLSIGCRQL